MSTEEQLQKHYILDTKEVDIDRAVYARFPSLSMTRVIHTRIAPTHADIPNATEELFNVIKDAPATINDNTARIVDWSYAHTEDPETGSTTLDLGLFYFTF
jgi:hypothetical protein